MGRIILAVSIPQQTAGFGSGSATNIGGRINGVQQTQQQQSFNGNVSPMLVFATGGDQQESWRQNENNGASDGSQKSSSGFRRSIPPDFMMGGFPAAGLGVLGAGPPPVAGILEPVRNTLAPALARQPFGGLSSMAGGFGMSPMGMPGMAGGFPGQWLPIFSQFLKK